MHVHNKVLNKKTTLRRVLADSIEKLVGLTAFMHIDVASKYYMSVVDIHLLKYSQRSQEKRKNLFYLHFFFFLF